MLYLLLFLSINTWCPQPFEEQAKNRESFSAFLQNGAQTTNHTIFLPPKPISSEIPISKAKTPTTISTYISQFASSVYQLGNKKSVIRKSKKVKID